MSTDRSAVRSVMQVQENIRICGNEPGSVERPVVRDGVAWNVRILMAAAEGILQYCDVWPFLSRDGDQIRVPLHPQPYRLVVFDILRVRHERNAGMMDHGRIQDLILNRSDPGVLSEHGTGN